MRDAVRNHNLSGDAQKTLSESGKLLTSFTFWDKKHIQGCGACAIYEFKRMGINNLKVLDRNLPPEEKIKATKFIKEAKDSLDNNSYTKQEFIEKCRELFKRTYKVKCSRYDCYYPDANGR